MTTIKRVACVAVAAMIFFSTLSAPVLAQDDGMGRILKDTVYGGAIGAIAGVAFMLFTDNPEDHFDYLATGAGIGILGGLAYGLATTSGRVAIAEIEDGRMTLNMPEIETRMINDEKTGVKEVVGTVGLLSYKF